MYNKERLKMMSETTMNAAAPYTANVPDVPYYAPRNRDFYGLIEGVLMRANLNRNYIQQLLDNEAMKMFSDAFTAESIDSVNNYQFFEQLGDISGNKFIVWYMYERFPQLKCAQGVKVVARLRIVYGAKVSFANIAESIGFWPFISAMQSQRDRSKKALLEDVFEAFLGVVETVLDSRLKIGVGYAVVYDILKSLFDGMYISLRYEDLFDAKTRLKEVFDKFPNLGSLQYKETIEKSGGYNIVTSTAYAILKTGALPMGSGKGSIKADAQQRAASMSIEFLKQQGYVKPAPPEFQMFQNY